MRRMMSPQLILGAVLLLFSVPQSSTLAIVREDFVSNTTMDGAALRAGLHSALSRVQAKMVKAGMKPRWFWDSWPDHWKPLTGQVWNCVQTFVETSDPIWSIAEGVASFQQNECEKSKNADSKTCLELSLGLTEDSLGALTWVLDFPTNCVELTCGGRTDQNGDLIPNNPVNRGVVMFSGLADMLAAVAGFATAHYTRILQCVDQEGDSLGDAFGKAWARYWHPGFSNFIPLVKEIREIWQISVASSTEIPWGRREKYLSAFEWIAGTVQTILEAEMDREFEENPPDKKQSAAVGCASAVSHIVAGVFALVGGYAKFMACKVGEWEPFQVNTVRAANGAQPFAGNPTPVANSNTPPVPVIPVVPGGQPQPGPSGSGPVTGTNPIPMPNIQIGNIAPPPLTAIQSPGNELVQPPNRVIPPGPPPPVFIDQPDLMPDEDSVSMEVQNPQPVPPPVPQDLPTCPYNPVDWEKTQLTKKLVQICDQYEHTFKLHTGKTDPDECRDECCGTLSKWSRKTSSRWCKSGQVGGPPEFQRMMSMDDIQEARQYMASDASSHVNKKRKEDADTREKVRRQKSRRTIILDDKV